MADLLNADQAARFLGIHPETVREKAREGEIPAGKVGAQWRFDPDVLREWIRAGGSAYERQVDEGLALAVADAKADVAAGRERLVPLDAVLRRHES